MEPIGAKRSPKGSTREPKGAQREPKGAKVSRKGAKMELKGTQREPKGSQRTTKMEPKADPEAMSEKGFQKGNQNELKMDHFGNQNRSKIYE